MMQQDKVSIVHAGRDINKTEIMEAACIKLTEKRLSSIHDLTKPAADVNCNARNYYKTEAICIGDESSEDDLDDDE